MIFTNYQFYMEEFCRLAEQYMDEGHPDYDAFVGPGNVIRKSARLGGGTSGTQPARDPQMPTYHLVGPDGRGITMVNIGIGPVQCQNDHRPPSPFSGRMPG